MICTHSDDGILASETELANYFKQEDQDVKPFFALSDRMKVKKTEIKTLKSKIAMIKEETQRATEQQMTNVRAKGETLNGLKREFTQLQTERFTFLVQTRNALITQRLQDTMQKHMPHGHTLEVHCISNSHYAALNRGGIRGPLLSAEATGVPKLRAKTIALMAPRLLNTLEKYVTFDVKVMLQELQLWLSTASIDRRSELLALASLPRDGLRGMFDLRLASHANNIQIMASSTLRQALPGASSAALEQLAKKEKKHWKTIEAFIRNGGNHVTKMCPKESWNEDFMRVLVDVINSSLAPVGRARVQLTSTLRRSIIDGMIRFRQSAKGTM